jgi:hypothetical protein
MPYYVMVNNASYIIECQEADRPADPWIKVNYALNWQKLLIICATHDDWDQWQWKLISSHKIKAESVENKIYEPEILKFGI